MIGADEHGVHLKHPPEGIEQRRNIMKTDSRACRFLIAVILIIMISVTGTVASGSEIKAAEGYKAGVNGFVVPLALYDAGGYYAVRTTAKVEVSYMFGSADIALSGSSCLYLAGADSLERVRDMPVVGQTYQFTMELYDNDPNPKNGSVNFSLLNAKDIRLFLDGFEVECVKIMLCTSGKSGRELTFEATKLYDAGVRGVTARVELYNASPNYAVGRRGLAEVEYSFGDAQVVMSGAATLFTADNGGLVTEEPKKGDRFIFYMDLYNPEPDKATVAFSVSTRSVFISMAGFGVECINVEPCPDGKNGVQLTLRAEMWAGAAVEGATALVKPYDSGNSEYAVNRYGAPDILFAFGSADVFMSGSAALFTDENYTRVKQMPTEGGHCYFYMDLYSEDTEDRTVDYSQVNPQKISITMEGFTVTCTNVEPFTGSAKYGVTLTLCAVSPSSRRIAGDANGDRRVDIFDALHILQYIRNPRLLQERVNADVDGDGLVDIKDAMLILQAECGWDVVLK